MARTLKIAVVSNVYPPVAIGGCGILAENLVDSLRARGHQVSVLVPEDVGRRRGQSMRNGILPIFKLTAPLGSPLRNSFPRRAWVAQANYRRAKRVLWDLDPDVVLLMHQGRMSLGAAYAAQDLRIPFLFSHHDAAMMQYRQTAGRNDLRGRIRMLLETKIYRRLTYRSLSLAHAICNSKRTREELCSQGFPAQNAQIIYPGIRVDRFRFRPKGRWPLKKINLLFVGNLNRDKGVSTVLEAVSLTKKMQGAPEVMLTIAGAGPLRQELQRESRERGLDGSLIFRGWVNNEDLPTLYYESDIFIFPSIWAEPFGMTLVEAMLCGVPVISTATGGNREFLVHGQNCLVFEAGNARELASRIKELIEDTSLYTTLSRNAAQEVRERFSLDMYVDQIEEILQGLASGRKG